MSSKLTVSCLKLTTSSFSFFGLWDLCIEITETRIHPICAYQFCIYVYFFFLVFCLKLNFSALLLCFVFICRRQRRCRRHIRTYERWYLLCRYVACFRFLPVPSRKVATHTHNRIPEEEKERHRNVQAHRHSTLTCIQYTTGTARSFCCSCRLSSGFIWSCSPAPLSYFVKLSLSPLPVPVALVLLSLYLTHFS